MESDLYRQVFENTYEFAGVLSHEGILIDANRTALNFIMKEKIEVVGRYFWDTEWWTHDEELRERLRFAIKTLQKDKQAKHFEVTHTRYDQRMAYFDFSLSPLLDEQGEIGYIIAEGRDVTDIKRAEHEREISEIRYKDLFKNSGDAYLIIEGDRCVDFNPAAMRMLGFDSQEALLGCHPSALSPKFQPDGHPSFEKANEMMAEAYRKSSHRFEWIHKKVDGSLFPVEVLMTPIRQDERLLLFTVWRDISEQKANEGHIQHLNRELENKVTERTKALMDSLEELETTQSILVESKKMAALGHLVVGISHEINTPVGTAITGVSYLKKVVLELKTLVAQRHEEGCEEVEDAIQDLQETSDQIYLNLLHAAELVSTFKSLSASEVMDKVSYVDFAEIVDQATMPFKKEILQHNYSIQLEVQEGLQLHTHPVTLGNIIGQLVSNAIYHGFNNQTGGQMRIEATKQRDGVHVTFSDNGRGLEAEELERIFDPFFTTRRGIGKNGLGMNIVYNQVHQVLHGSVTVKNQDAGGCQIILVLPQL